MPTISIILCTYNSEAYISELERLLRESQKVLKDAFFANHRQTAKANELYDEISKTIGADDIAKLAAGLEAAAKKGDVEVILAQNDSTIERYDALVRSLKAFMPEVMDSVGDDEEIMEFLPL